jgi:hypothetical protein
MDTPETSPWLEPKKALWFIGICSVAAITLLAWVSTAQPLPFEPVDWNYLTSSTLNMLASLGAAIAGSMVTRQFGRDENPYRVWLIFTLGLWCWAIGQGVIFAIDVAGVPYPEGNSIIDLLWIMGYFFLGLSLYHQLALLYTPGREKRIPLYVFLVLVALLISVLVTNVARHAGLGLESTWGVAFVAMLYPVFDLAEGTGAIWLSLLFGRGQWSRPWWGMILFAIADGIDSFYWLGGYELIHPAVQNVFNFMSATFSFGGYLVIGFTLLTNYYILRYGHTSGLLKPPKISTPPFRQ